MCVSVNVSVRVSYIYWWCRYFLRGSLPWQGIRADSKQQRYQQILEKKIATPFETLCKDVPNEFILYLEYCRKLNFEDKPDYRYLRKIFKFVGFLSPRKQLVHFFLSTICLNYLSREPTIIDQRCDRSLLPFSLRSPTLSNIYQTDVLLLSHA